VRNIKKTEKKWLKKPVLADNSIRYFRIIRIWPITIARRFVLKIFDKGTLRKYNQHYSYFPTNVERSRG